MFLVSNRSSFFVNGTQKVDWLVGLDNLARNLSSYNSFKSQLVSSLTISDNDFKFTSKPFEFFI